MNAKDQSTLHSQLAAQIKKLDSISTAPAILTPLLEMMRMPSEKIVIEKVVELISYDGAIAAQCLRLANSPLFGRREVETVRSRPGASAFDPFGPMRESGDSAG